MSCRGDWRRGAIVRVTGELCEVHAIDSIDSIAWRVAILALWLPASPFLMWSEAKTFTENVTVSIAISLSGGGVWVFWAAAAIEKQEREREREKGQ